MGNERFDALVRRLEPQAAASPGVYKARVLLLALLGYVYIGAVLATLLALLAGCVWLMLTTRGVNYGLYKIAVGLAIFAGVVARALWVRSAPPGGRPLTRDEAPRLFDEAEALRRTLQAPRADVVLLTDDYNAAVSQVPRLGILGWPRNYLIVGLPLLEALPAEQVRAVLAHEFAHLSRAHGKFGGWIYRVRVTWYQLMARLDQPDQRLGFVFRWFCDWYAPYFGAYTFVLMRQHEYEADRLAASVVGREVMAQTLVDLRVRGAFIAERFWPAVWKDAEEREAPPDDVYSRLAATTRSPLPEAETAGWLASALKRRTDTNDTHPALRDRLAAIAGGSPAGSGTDADGSVALRASRAFEATGADHYLGAAHARLAAEMATAWRGAADAAWKQRHAEVREVRAGLATLAEKERAGSLDAEERWQHAMWTEELAGSEAAFPLYRALLDENPDHLSAAFAIGRILLGRGDDSGIALVERAMERDESAVLPGCGVVYEFLAREGRLEEADRYRERGAQRASMLDEAGREREYLTSRDSYLPADLPAEAVRSIVAQLDAIEGVKRAYLVRKVVRHFADEAPLHVLAVVPAPVRLSLNPGQAERKAAEAIVARLELPPGVNAFAMPRQAAVLLKPIRKVKGALVYESGKRKRERREATAERAA